MIAFLVRRLLIAVPTLLVLVVAAFFLMRFAPGGPFDGERPMPPEIRANVLAAYHLDKPIEVQLGYYLGDLVRGDLGPSLKYKDKTVADIIAEGFPVSATIGLSAMILAGFVGVALGVMAAIRQNTAHDYGVMAFAMLGICVPTFVMGPILSLVFGLKLNWFPAAGLDPIDGMTVQSLILPVVTLALPQIAIISRLMRASMIESMKSNFVRTARAKGLPERTVVTRHALRAALNPLVSYLGPATAGLLTGSVIIENVFQLPGIGRQFIIGALQRDYTLVMGVVILYAALIIFLNIIADALYAVLDPRVRAQ